MSTPTEVVLSRYSDINARYGFKNGIVLETGIDAINNSIENILGTSFGERLFLPQFGSKIKALLFENINDDTAQRIFDALTDAISKWEPRIRVSFDESYIVPEPDSNLYKIYLVYTLTGTDITGQFQVNISNL